MSDSEDTLPPRPGTYADLSRRMDRMEVRHEDLAKDVTALSSTVAQVVLNQQHAEQINELRFKSLDTAVGQVGTDLKAFMVRIDGVISGEVETAQSRQGVALIADFMAWRKITDADIAALKTQNTRQGGINAGIGATFGQGKAVVVTIAACTTAVLAILSALHVIS